jgi:hypothetical protein
MTGLRPCVLYMDMWLVVRSTALKMVTCDLPEHAKFDSLSPAGRAGRTTASAIPITDDSAPTRKKPNPTADYLQMRYENFERELKVKDDMAGSLTTISKTLSMREVRQGLADAKLSIKEACELSDTIEYKTVMKMKFEDAKDIEDPDMRSHFMNYKVLMSLQSRLITRFDDAHAAL